MLLGGVIFILKSEELGGDYIYLTRPFVINLPLNVIQNKGSGVAYKRGKTHWELHPNTKNSLGTLAAIEKNPCSGRGHFWQPAPPISQLNYSENASFKPK